MDSILPEALEATWLTLRLGGSEKRLTPHPYEGEARLVRTMFYVKKHWDIPDLWRNHLSPFFQMGDYLK